MFGAIDYSFLYWIFFGAAGVLVFLGALEWFKELKITMTWWKWAVLAIWYVSIFLMIGAPVTIMGEGEVAAGWRMMAFDAVVVVILSFTAYRILKIEGKKSA